MKTLTIRGIDDELEKAIRDTARKKQESLNQTVLKLLKSSVGLSKSKAFPKYDDLNELAGTWTAKEETAFYQNTQSLMNEVDEEIWE